MAPWKALQGDASCTLSCHAERTCTGCGGWFAESDQCRIAVTPQKVAPELAASCAETTSWPPGGSWCGRFGVYLALTTWVQLGWPKRWQCQTCQTQQKSYSFFILKDYDCCIRFIFMTKYKCCLAACMWQNVKLLFISPPQHLKTYIYFFNYW